MTSALLALIWTAASVSIGFAMYFAAGAFACLPDKRGFALTSAIIAALAAYVAVDLAVMAGR